MTDHLDYGVTEDRTMPAVAYALYLLGFATAGLTSVVGVIIAYSSQATAGPQTRSHYTFLIRTFWIGLVWCVIAGMVLGIGIPLSFILIGIPLLILAKVMFALGAVWYGLRCVVGVIYLAQGEPYPRPYANLV
ncbi:DUF4870 family protein [Phenylobacterium sp.]|uniref:DUF4870 family protein n=1 Tax=Phenylobacterium sp. TaxID=1871053 RepID=UPI003567EF26